MEIVFTQLSDLPPYEGAEEDFETIMKKTLSLLNVPEDRECSVIFCSPAQIQEINRDYRNIDRSTDVISFAMQDEPAAFFTDDEELQELAAQEQAELGDIFINLEAAVRQAQMYGHSIRRETCFLFCHGLLHLLGYDHMDEEDEAVMFGLQDQILDEMVSR